MAMKHVKKLMLVPVEEWEKIRRQHPKINQVSSVKVEQSPQMKNMKVMKSGNNVTMKKKYQTEDETENETEIDTENERENEGEEEYE